MGNETENRMNFIVKGDFIYNKTSTEFECIPGGYLVCIDGKVEGIYETVPQEFEDLEIADYSGKLIFPGLTDLHLHASQFAYRGTHMDEELLDWLQKYTFPEEEQFSDTDYAREAYSIFAEAMRRSATTRASIFATVHIPATIILMDEMEKTGLVTYVGKVNMNRDAPLAITEGSADISAFRTLTWLAKTEGRYRYTRPILTPRFIPSCTNALLEELEEILEEYRIPVQSHLSENPDEVELVRKLMPEAKYYGDAYARFSLFGNLSKTIMAHCIYSGDEEIELIRRNGVFVAHCPSSNMNLRSGIAPIRKYLDLGIHVGLGTDVAGGESESLFVEIKKAIEVSKLYQRYIDPEKPSISFAEAFYLATKSGGAFFGYVGSFEQGYEFDAVVLDDEQERHPQPLSLEERLERSVYLGLDKRFMTAKYVSGRLVYSAEEN